MFFILVKIAFTIRNAQISGKFTSCIIILARREKYKKYQKILKNYETSGHSLDTITAQFFPVLKRNSFDFYSAQDTYFWTQYSKENCPLQLGKGRE